MDRPKWTVWLPAVFAVIVASFVAATLLGTWKMRAIDDRAVAIAENAAPSIEHLAAARVEVRNLQLIVRSQLDHGPDRFDDTPIEASQKLVDEAVNDYLVLPTFPGERELWHDILEAKNRLDEAVTRIEQDAARGDIASARRIADTDLVSAIIDFNNAITHVTELDASRAHDLAMEIRGVRASASNAALALDVGCTLIAIAGALLLRHVIRTYAGLVEAHQHLQEARASELEQFAGRVAHDILSPLGTVALALDVAEKVPPDQRARILGRGRAAVGRVKRLVDGLLSFARAGAKPEPDASADVREAMLDLATELEPTAIQDGIELRIEPGRGEVACAPGVLTSLVSNLARNAMKYMGDGPLRRIDIRTIDRGSMLRVEVEDTGPGLPADVEDRVFDPYARGRSSTQPGIGLGLATVKRLAESHGGSVGVRSSPGQGCLFWFELPKSAQSSSSRAAANRDAGSSRAESDLDGTVGTNGTHAPRLDS